MRVTEFEHRAPKYPSISFNTPARCASRSCCSIKGTVSTSKLAQVRGGFQSSSCNTSEPNFRVRRKHHRPLRHCPPPSPPPPSASRPAAAARAVSQRSEQELVRATDSMRPTEDPQDCERWCRRTQPQSTKVVAWCCQVQTSV